MMDALRFAITLGVLYAAHQVADHWIQTHHQACHKAATGPRGWLALFGHVATYTATLAAVLAAVAWRFPVLDYSAGMVAAGLIVNAISHGWADRRSPLRALAVAVGKGSYWDDVPGGAYQLDQAWHYGWLAVCAFIIAA
jgi:hypothetical protein